MESKLSPDKEKITPPVPIKTYQWEDLRRSRESGGYPWTHLLKYPLQGEITAEDIIRETTPRRSMSREFSKSRTQSPVDKDVQKILNLDSSPGSSRKHGDEGEDEGVHIPSFSKEVSIDSEDDAINQAVKAYIVNRSENESVSHLAAPIELPKNVSPKSILKRRAPELQYSIGVTETREKTKCCHPLVNKIKHLADKTLHKLERNENEKSPSAKRKKNDNPQEIRQLKSSPGAVRRQKFSVIKLGDSDEMSKSMCTDTPPPRKKKEHIYEDIEEKKNESEKNLKFSEDVDIQQSTKVEDENKSNSYRDNESVTEKKSNASYDPSLIADETTSLKLEEHIMEKLHKKSEIDNEAVFLDDEMDPDEPNVEEIFQNQLDEVRQSNDSPNITITEVIDDDTENNEGLDMSIAIETSPSPSPHDIEREQSILNNAWSKPSSDHEYEIIEKPSQNYVFNTVTEKSMIGKTEDELSSTTSLERKYLQHNSDDDERTEEKEKEDGDEDGKQNVEELQKDIEDRFFLNTPSTISRTECEISTSQVDSSALENLPLKRENRSKNPESIDSRIQQHIKESTGKLKTQAGKLKSKLQNIKTKQFSMPQKPKINQPEQTKPKASDRPKISFPERSKFSLPSTRKFSLPARPKFKTINISEKLNLGDRKKFTLPERPKFNVPDFPKFKIPERPKINFPSLSKKKEYKVETTTSNSDLKNVASVDFEVKTYPRIFGRKKKSELPKTSSSPTLNREETPPPTFTFTRVKNIKQNNSSTYIPDSPEEPREYGNIGNEREIDDRKQFEDSYDFDKVESDQSNFTDTRNATSIPDLSPSNQEFTHVINEINNDEFFVRPRGISRENIQVREYLSDEIRQAFKIPKNVLELMGSNLGINDNSYDNEPEADPELMVDENEPMQYSTEDLNDKDDGYYTFPPVRPSRTKHKKKIPEPIQYIDDSIHTSMQFTEVDLGLPGDHISTLQMSNSNLEDNEHEVNFDLIHVNDLHSIHEYANDDVIEYPENVLMQSQTLPMPPKRKKKLEKAEIRHLSLNALSDSQTDIWDGQQQPVDDIVVYRTEHEYIVPQVETTVTEQSPIPPRRSRSSRGTSLCDDDRTSHGAESLTLDTHVPHSEYIDDRKEIRHESPGYATIDKGVPGKIERSKSKTPPNRRRKSNSSERKYYTVGPSKHAVPDRPPRKKSSTSLMTLDSLANRSISGDITQYVEIEEPKLEEIPIDLNSGEIVSKMKDRPLPPPPRPPRGSRKDKKKKHRETIDTEIIPIAAANNLSYGEYPECVKESTVVQEIEVSTQTDPLPDDMDFELGMDENFDVSMSSSLRDIIEDESLISKVHSKVTESPRYSRPTSRSDKSLKLSDPKISDLSKSNLGRTSPTVILVEKRVSSPTRINEREEMLTEASLTVHHIDIDESQMPDVPPLPKSRILSSEAKSSQKMVPLCEDRALERVSDPSRDIQLDNLITQRLQVRDLDVGRLNVTELQASKILVSDIEGMTLQVTELDSKSGHISVSGIEFSQSVIDEIVKKFAEITTTQASTSYSHESQVPDQGPESREEQTQTDKQCDEPNDGEKSLVDESHSIILPSVPPLPAKFEELTESASPSSRPSNLDDASIPPQRPPPPDLAPLLYSYLQDISAPSPPFCPPRLLRERPFTDFHESQHQSPAQTTRRPKRKPVAPHSESSSDEDRHRPSPRRMGPPVKSHEPTVTEAGVQFLRVCQNSISRTIRHIFNCFMSYVSGTEDKKDVQMALVIFLVLIAGLIMFGLSDSRTIHHHHWEFFNPPDGKQ